MGGDDLSESASRAATVLPRAATNDQREVLDDRYSIVRMIGRGGMGAIYLGEDRRLQKRVAIKMLHGHVAFDAEEVGRFHREAIAIAQIGNPHIVSATDIGTLRDGRTFIVLELLEGQNLRSALAAGPMDIKRAMLITQQALDAIGAAHAAGFIHRDLKPENIFLTKQRNGDDFVKLLDFGVAALVAPGANTKLTQTGNLIGTPVYMAPEQARSKPFDHRIDIYALGVVLFELLTGQQPFGSDALYELLRQIVTEPLPSVIKLRSEVPPWLEAVVYRATAKDPDARYATAEEFLRALPTSRATFGIAAVTPQEVANIVARPSTVAPPAGAPASEIVQAHTVKIAMREQTSGELAGLGREVVVQAGPLAAARDTPKRFRRAAWIGGGVTVLAGAAFAWMRWQGAPQPVAEVAALDARHQPLAEVAALDAPRAPATQAATRDAPQTEVAVVQVPPHVGQPQPTTNVVTAQAATRAVGDANKPAVGKTVCDGAAWMADGEKLFADARYADALRAFEAAMQCSGNTNAARIAGLAACKAHNAARARYWYKVAGGSTAIAQSCLQQSPQIKMAEPDERAIDIGGSPTPSPTKNTPKAEPQPAAGVSDRNQTIDPFAP
jgi:serine/threonine-protein kinase